MSAADAPPVLTASYMCSGLPAPPEAMTGMFTASAMARVSVSS